VARRRDVSIYRIPAFNGGLLETIYFFFGYGHYSRDMLVSASASYDLLIPRVKKENQKMAHMSITFPL
jgi:hypothetical protein